MPHHHPATATINAWHSIPLHTSDSAFRITAKSSKLQSPKNLHGGLRCATRGWLLKYKSCTQSLDFKPFLLIAPLSIFYFFFSVCVYNLWVITNMILGIVLGVITDKSLITAKRLIVHLQMSLVEKQPP